LFWSMTDTSSEYVANKVPRWKRIRYVILISEVSFRLV